MFILPIRGFDMRRAIWITTGILLALFAGFSVWYFGGAKSQAQQHGPCVERTTVSDVWSSSKGDARLIANEECGHIWVRINQQTPENNRAYVVGYTCEAANSSCRGESKSVNLNTTGTSASGRISLADYKAFRLCWSPNITSGPFVFCSSKYNRVDMRFPEPEPTYPGADRLMAEYGTFERIGFDCPNTDVFEKYDIEFFDKGDTYANDVEGTMPRPSFRLTLDPQDEIRGEPGLTGIWNAMIDCISATDRTILDHESFDDIKILNSLLNQLICHVEDDSHRNFFGIYQHTGRRDYHIESFWIVDQNYAIGACNGTEYY